MGVGSVAMALATANGSHSQYTSALLSSGGCLVGCLSAVTFLHTVAQCQGVCLPLTCASGCGCWLFQQARLTCDRPALSRSPDSSRSPAGAHSLICGSCSRWAGSQSRTQATRPRGCDQARWCSVLWETLSASGEGSGCHGEECRAHTLPESYVLHALQLLYQPLLRASSLQTKPPRWCCPLPEPCQPR